MHSGRDSESISFGPFRLIPGARVLEKNGQPVDIGNRALDILIVLVERAGEVVNARELVSRVWRGLVVCPSNLRVHMNALRKALNDSAVEARYIANVTGQGYCFVAPIRRYDDSVRVRCSLSRVLDRMVGRDTAVRIVATEAMTDRFVTVVGPGGIGKTTVAVAAAHSLVAEFAGAVCFVDLGAICDSADVVSNVASTLGLAIETESALLERLRGERMLLVLDNCEHVIAAAAAFAERVFSEAPGVHILATSREALRVEGERAYLLPPLSSPSPSADLTAEVALRYPAVQLFAERASASGRRSPLTDGEAPIVASICRKLDGIALAIELAAGQVGTHGIVGTWNLLQQRHGLHWRGRRTAPTRHQTLHGSLEWSYQLLDETEQLALRSLSALNSEFTVEAAAGLTTITALDALVAKSFVSVLAGEDGSVGYRFPEMTRAYLLEGRVRSRCMNRSGFPSIARIPDQEIPAGRAQDESHSRTHA